MIFVTSPNLTKNILNLLRPMAWLIWTPTSPFVCEFLIIVFFKWGSYNCFILSIYQKKNYEIHSCHPICHRFMYESNIIVKDFFNKWVWLGEEMAIYCTSKKKNHHIKQLGSYYILLKVFFRGLLKESLYN